MVNQNSVERVRQDVSLDWMVAARLRTIVKGQTMPAIEYKDRKTRMAEKRRAAKEAK